MKTLVLTSGAPTSDSSGYDLRVAHLCRETPGELHLAVVALSPTRGDETQQGPPAGFDSVRQVVGLGSGPQQRRRHARLSDGRYLRLSRPRAFERAKEQLATLVSELEIDWVVAFGGDLAELAAAIGHPRTVLDVCDSVSLTRRRQLEVVPHATSFGRWKSRIDLVRSRSQEKRLPSQFRQVTTISEQDSAELRGLARQATNVITIPNGVDESYLTGMLPAGRRHAVAFWGNLQFGPNQEALRYYLMEVHEPHLREQGVHVRIIGPSAPEWLVQMARTDASIELLGFVPDLRQALADFPVAVNAMRTGSGLKNKVLEAFGLGLVVVTTIRGIEALPSVRDGVHVIMAEDAESFARAVGELLSDAPQRDRMRTAAHALLCAEYRWSVIGESWRTLFTESASGGSKSPAAS